MIIKRLDQYNIQVIDTENNKDFVIACDENTKLTSTGSLFDTVNTALLVQTWFEDNENNIKL